MLPSQVDASCLVGIFCFRPPLLRLRLLPLLLSNPSSFYQNHQNKKRSYTIISHRQGDCCEVLAHLSIYWRRGRRSGEWGWTPAGQRRRSYTRCWSSCPSCSSCWRWEEVHLMSTDCRRNASGKDSRWQRQKRRTRRRRRTMAGDSHCGTSPRTSLVAPQSSRPRLPAIIQH